MQRKRKQKMLNILFRSDPSNPLLAILCGVIGSVVVVFLVIIITMKVCSSPKIKR